MFSFKIKSNVEYIKEKLDINNRLENRVKISPIIYNSMMDLRESQFNLKNYKTEIIKDNIFPNTFVLTNVTNDYIRHYKVL